MRYSKGRYTLATKLNSTRSTLWKVNKVDRVVLAPYTLATKSTVSATKSTVVATKSTATSCRIQVVADLSPKPATKSAVSATVDFVANLSPISATASGLCRQCVPGLTDTLIHASNALPLPLRRR